MIIINIVSELYLKKISMVNPNSSLPNLHKANGGKQQIDKQQQKARQQEELNNNTRRIEQYAWELGQNGT